MFPKLSQKALDQMRKHYNTTPIGKTSACDFEIIDAYNALFDLEKHPITHDMLFEYLRDEGFRDRCPNKKVPSTKENWSFDMGNGCVYGHADSWMDINSILNEISSYEPKDKIIIIGEIHGWWEKGVTQ